MIFCLYKTRQLLIKLNIILHGCFSIVEQPSTGIVFCDMLLCVFHKICSRTSNVFDTYEPIYWYKAIIMILGNSLKPLQKSIYVSPVLWSDACLHNPLPLMMLIRKIKRDKFSSVMSFGLNPAMQQSTIIVWCSQFPPSHVKTLPRARVPRSPTA